MRVALIVFLCCVTFTVAQLSLQFNINSRSHDSSYAGLAFIDEKQNMHALMSQKRESLQFEYHSQMGSNAFMYIREKDNCHRLNVPVPSALLSALQEPLNFLTQRKNVVDSRILDSKVATCVNNNTVSYLTLDDGTQVVLCGDKEIPSRIVGEMFEIDISIASFTREHFENLLQEFNSCDGEKRFTPKNSQSTSKRTLERKVQEGDKLWFIDYAKTCRFDHMRNDAECVHMDKGFAAPAKTCVFLHGVGQTLADKGPPSPEYPDYWGNSHMYTPQCKERIFIREETKDRGWTSEELQKSFCNVALYGSRNRPEKDTVIRNTILFVHSMGNLILAAAIKNGFCEVDTKTTTWYSLMGPYAGSKVVPLLEEICEDAQTGEWPVSKAKLYRFVADAGGYCVPHSIHPYHAYATMRPAYCDHKHQVCLEELHGIAGDRINGSMCGDSPYGISSRYSAGLKILSEIVGYGEPNDGMVPLNSCMYASKGAKFSVDFKQPNYLSAINHSDGTCRNGDSYWSEGAKPCSYLASRT